MSYYANGCGWAKPKDGCSKETINELTKEIGYRFNVWFEKYSIVDTDYNKLIDIEFENDKYGDWVEEALNMLNDIICDGEVKFTGEDGEHWRFRFIDGEWVEEGSTIVYGFNSYDDQLAAATSLKNWAIGMYQNHMSDAEMNKEMHKRMKELGLFGD